MTRACAWCAGPIPARARRDAVCCSVRCRQARHRFMRAVGYAESVAAGRPLRLAYADPPYPGKARLYRDHPDYGGEVDHAALLGQLAGYDGWALSTSAEALPGVLALCPPGVRVAAWHRGERPVRSRWPLHAWEPVLYSGGRQLISEGRRVDSLVCGAGPLDTLPAGWSVPSPRRCAGGFSRCWARRRATCSMTCFRARARWAGPGRCSPASRTGRVQLVATCCFRPRGRRVGYAGVRRVVAGPGRRVAPGRG